MWKDDVDMQIKLISSNLVLALVVGGNPRLTFALVCIYGDPYHRLDNVIWDTIESFVYDNLDIPMLCMGDLKNIMLPGDKSSPRINVSRMQRFN
ncbi:hypothetical protein BRADI_5g15445v3 [Brachypodium distachyon]|uniref:Uncharacterized protein n=1 Tax=Brachypodium distachyon TaxID=15368 RepID=A0A0Q3KTH3_BRADI|nr:hypothetical protein BRADI_5g15445v3 [Brachypodium distachyon]